MMTSPTRPIACESDDMIEIAPRSCSRSSAAIVSGRMRDSAKTEGFDHTREERVALSPEQMFVIDFRSETGEFVFR